MSSNLPPAFLGLRARQIDLVDDRNDLEVVLDGQVGVRQRLRLHALGRIHQQQRALARGERARHLVPKSTCPGVSMRLSTYCRPPSACS